MLEIVEALRFVVAALTAYLLPGYLILTSVRSRSEELKGANLVLLSVSLSVLITTLTLFWSSVFSVPFEKTVLLLSVSVICLAVWRSRTLSRRHLQERLSEVMDKINEYLRSLTRFEKIFFVVVVYQLLISIMHTIYWPVFSWDALGYWLYLGRAYYEEGTMHLTNHQLFWEIPSHGGRGMAYPQFIPLLYSWLFTSVGRVDLLLANSIQLVFLLMLVLCVYQLFKGAQSGRVSFLACLFFLLFSHAIATQWDVFKGVADFPLFVSSLTLIHFVLRFWRNPSTSNALAAGVIGGLTAAIKQLGLIFVLLAGVLIFLRSVQETEQPIISRITQFAYYAASTLALSAPYYAYSVSEAPAETIAYWSPTIMPTFDLKMLLDFTVAVLHGVSPRAWGLPPIIAFIAVLIAWRRSPLTKIVLFWMLGSLFAYYLFISTTQLGSLEMSTLSVPKYTLPIFSLFAVLAGGALGAFWQRRETQRGVLRKIYAVVIVAVLVSNVTLSFGVMQSYLLPPFMTSTGRLVERDLDEKYAARLGGFYEVAVYINGETPPRSVIITPGYYRYFFFNARDQRKLYGLEEKPGLWTSNFTKLKSELRDLESPCVFVVEEPWYVGLAPYEFYFQTALYLHRDEIMTVLLRTSDGYLLYQVSQEFLAGACERS